MRDHDNRVGVLITLAVTLVVFGLARLPLERAIELDLRAGDDVGGWNQITLVGFTVARPDGRAIPDQPGRQDLRIVSNRPLPPAFDLEIEASWAEELPRGQLGVAVGDSERELAFGREPRRASARLTNPWHDRTIRLRLPSEVELAVTRIAIRPAAPAG